MSESIDVFNGDADGILALHQLRIVEPKDSKLVTGLKRDIALLKQVSEVPGAIVTVLDISLERNVNALKQSLENQQKVLWFDHHLAGDIPNHTHLETHIDHSPEVCTAILVDSYLGHQYKDWAIAGAFGDNLHAVARKRGAEHSEGDLEKLQEIGEAINYNAYGESRDDQTCSPEDVVLDLRKFDNPFEYYVSSQVFKEIIKQKESDTAAMQSAKELYSGQAGKALLLPDGAASRRMSGIFSNDLVYAEPGLAHAIMTNFQDGYRISIRAPLDRPQGADVLAKKFSGGGRAKASGVDCLPKHQLDDFCSAMEEVFVC